MEQGRAAKFVGAGPNYCALGIAAVEMKLIFRAKTHAEVEDLMGLRIHFWMGRKWRGGG